MTPQPDSAVVVLEPDATAAVVALLGAAEATDGARALSEQAELALHHRRAGTLHLGVYEAGELAGYLQVALGDQPVAEGVVAPVFRRQGLGTALLRRGRAEAGGPLHIWAHSGGDAAKSFLTGLGATRVRRLLQMSRELDAASVPGATLPAGVRVRSFVIGQDEQALLEVNRLAFAHHPEQGAMTLADLNDRIAEPWFDPAGLLLLEESATGELLGFHWTKVHPATATEPATGEVYVIGLAPKGQGHGLGRTLVVIGLAHLASPAATPSGPVTRAILYVEADNASALAIYTGLRFAIAHVDEQYLLP